MKSLEEKILREGEILPGSVLKVGSFLNQRIDVPFMNEMAKEGVKAFSDCRITKVFTVEASGIAFGFAAASALGVPMVFAKKARTANLSGRLLCTEVFSYTHNNRYVATVSADFLTPDDCVLLVDDFLATGEALRGLADLARQAGAQVAGALIAVEKGFQKGGDELRAEGMRVVSLANIDRMSPDGTILFRS